ncbi:MAG: T9SS type A sorting domain-containing protein, partial [Paludibacteraceae bacterium]|nr:T9SS type A sorting domain-containing protein [Bacteroidia bacterium]MBP7369403.1 T9SS type A sorting domain-containing protein [Paludibacteraceae bacterium]
FFVKECPDGGFIISGTTYDSFGNSFPWITKVDQFGTTVSIAEPKSTVDFEVTYQNQSIIVKQSSGDKIIVYNLTGKIISKIENVAHTTYIPFENDGIYIVSIYKGSNLVGSKKLFVPEYK